MKFQVTKTYGHELGLSACFRQPLAKSHCRFLHGYALSFKFVFESDELDENGWVIDFGGLKYLKAWLIENFDHKTVISAKDPKITLLREMHIAGIIDLQVVPAVGCEAFARMAFDVAQQIVDDVNSDGEHSVRLVSAECREHAGNSAICFGKEAA
jgi:6-pyruvoyltetrahydropterin/6-carboxytetrahydropterin synthase